MNAPIRNDRQEVGNLRKSPLRDDHAAVLLIQREENGRLYTQDVLRRAGFRVRAVTPEEIGSLDNEAAGIYPLVILNNTLRSHETSQIGVELRRRSPRSKLLLLLGPNSAGIHVSLFDAVMEGLDGPEMLVRTARALMNGETIGDARDLPA